MMSPAGYQWMTGGTNAPGWMRGGSLPSAMMGTGTDPPVGRRTRDSRQPIRGRPARQPDPGRCPRRPGRQHPHLHRPNGPPDRPRQPAGRAR
jgi:hypothetical protein